MNGGGPALTTSLLLARISARGQPLREHHLLERLQKAASAVGCQSPDLVTALYVGLKLHWWSIVCGPARDRAMVCLDALITTIVGAQSGQTLHIHGPIGTDAVAQRFAAVRLGDFVATALDQAEQNKAWFVLVDTPGEPTAMLHWLEREVGAMLQAHGRPAHMLPNNLFVLTVAGAWPSEIQRCWLPLAAPPWGDMAVEAYEAVLPPVGYQRQLLASQLTGPVYRRRLREGRPATRQFPSNPAQLAGLSRRERWLAASVDEQQQGLWEPNDRLVNTRKALAVLDALQHVPATVV